MERKNIIHRHKHEIAHSSYSTQIILFLFVLFCKNFFKYLFAQGGSQTPHPFFLPTSFLYVNLVAREHRMSFRTLAPRLTVLDIPYFADAYSRTVRPIDLHNF